MEKTPYEKDVLTLRKYSCEVRRQRVKELYSNRRRTIRKHKIKSIFDLFEIGKYD